jgi:hypothetical protein
VRLPVLPRRNDGFASATPCRNHALWAAHASLKMNFIFKMPDAILTLHVAEAH